MVGGVKRFSRKELRARERGRGHGDRGFQSAGKVKNEADVSRETREKFRDFSFSLNFDCELVKVERLSNGNWAFSHDPELNN